jgi:hypothetical protein
VLVEEIVKRRRREVMLREKKAKSDERVSRLHLHSSHRHHLRCFPGVEGSANIQ